MATELRVDGDALITGALSVSGAISGVSQTDLPARASTEIPLDVTAWRVWDNLGSLLPATPAADDLGIVSVFAADGITIETGDLKTAGLTSRYARTQVTLPHDYVPGSAITLRLHAGMVSTIADGTAELDAVAHKSDDEGAVGGDLVTTVIADMNSVTFADKDFALTSTGLVAGDQLDIRVEMKVNDAATVTEVNAKVGKAALIISRR